MPHVKEGVLVIKKEKKRNKESRRNVVLLGRIWPKRMGPNRFLLQTRKGGGGGKKGTPMERRKPRQNANKKNGWGGGRAVALFFFNLNKGSRRKASNRTT